MSDLTRRKAILFAAAMACGAGLAEVARPRLHDTARAAQRLDMLFPAALGDWRLEPTAVPLVQPLDERGRIYGFYDQVLERSYADVQGRRVMLCVAYGSEQSPALQVHRPEICYASGGFSIRDLHASSVDLGARRLPVVCLHASKFGRSEPVTYWIVLGDEVVNEGNNLTWRRLLAGLRGEVRDGMLLRVSSIGSDPGQAYRVHAAFISAMAQALPREMGRRAFGAKGRKVLS